MVKQNLYDPAYHTYVHSCRHVQCPVHCLRESRRRFHRRKRAFDDRPFRSFIFHYGYRPDPDEVKEDMETIRSAFLRFDPKATVAIQLHPKNGDYHLHVGVQSAWFDMEMWLTGYWCPDTNRFVSKRGPKKKFCLGCVGEELSQKLLVKRQGRLVEGQFENQPERWLWYVMRCKHGWSQQEVLPKFAKHKLFSGLITRGRRTPKVSRAAIRAVLLAAITHACILVPLASGEVVTRPLPRPLKSAYRDKQVSVVPVSSPVPSARGPPGRVGAGRSGSRTLTSSPSHDCSHLHPNFTQGLQ
jgi:hypothetical protein